MADRGSGIADRLTHDQKEKPKIIPMVLPLSNIFAPARQATSHRVDPMRGQHIQAHVQEQFAPLMARPTPKATWLRDP
jgi:hypothetical protein